MHLSALKEKLTVAKELAYAKRVEEHKQKCRERKLKRKERNNEMKQQKKRTATAKNMPGCAGNEATAGSSGPQVTVTHKKDGKRQDWQNHAKLANSQDWRKETQQKMYRLAVLRTWQPKFPQKRKLLNREQSRQQL